MKVLLVNSNREQMPWPAVPLGLCMVAGAAEAAGHAVELLDLTFAREPARELHAALVRRVPDVVGVSVRNLDNCNLEVPVFYLKEIRDRLMRTLRAFSAELPVVIGGSAVNVSARQCLEYLGADYAVEGEGEVGLVALLAALQTGRSPAGLPGIWSRAAPQRALPTLGAGGSPGGPGRVVVEDLRRAARSEAWRWVDLPSYARRGGPYPVQTKRGCALRCSYCVYNNIEGRSYRLREPAHVVDEIEEAVREHGVRHVDFVDSTFNLPLSHGRAICAELERRKLPVELSTMGLNPAGVDDAFVEGMKRAGFSTVMCTPESASDVTLTSLDKGYDKRAVVRAAAALRKADLRTFWFFMLGAPGETLDTVRETLAFCEEHVPPTDMVLFTTGIRVYAGTPLERTCKASGWFTPDDPLFLPSWYFSPSVDLQALYGLLVQAAATHPNWMVNAETVLSPRFSSTMKGAFRMLGWRGPFWQYLPRVFEMASRFGARQRGLEGHARSVEKIADVTHHR